VNGQGKLNMHIIFKSMLMLFTKKLSKVVHGCRNYTACQSWRVVFETQCIITRLHTCWRSRR